jgi:PEP-CTERM motif
MKTRLAFAALAVALAIPAAARASSITQTDLFFEESFGGSTQFPYDKFDPALAPLREVVLSVTGTIGFGGGILVNETGSTINYTETVGFTFNLLGQDERVSAVLSGTLLPGQTFSTGVLLPYSATEYITAPGQVAAFVGTGVLGPDVPMEPSPFATGTPGIFLSTGPEVPNYNMQEGGTETITYIYGVPEPSSVLMLGLGLAGAGGLAWRRRKSR